VNSRTFVDAFGCSLGLGPAVVNQTIRMVVFARERETVGSLTL
jgi:hypothetical protein